MVSRQGAAGYQVEGTMGGENNARVLPPDAKALYWWWLGLVERRYHERERARSRPKRPVTGEPWRHRCFR